MKILLHSDSTGIGEQKPLLFADRLWESVASEGFQRLEVVKGKDIRYAFFSIFTYKKFGHQLVITPPMAPHCGLTIFEDFDKLYKEQTEKKRLLGSIAQYLITQFPHAYIDLGFPPSFKDVQPFKTSGFDIDVSYTYILHLQERAGDDILAHMDASRRKNIRDAESKDYTIRIDANPAIDIIQLVEDTLKNKNENLDVEMLRRILEDPSDRFFSIGVYRDATLLATAVIGSDSDAAYYLAGGTKRDSSLEGTYALWRAILESKKRGLSKFDFLGSSIPSIERYFRGFGGEITPYFRAKRNTKVFDTLKAAKKKLF